MDSYHGTSARTAAALQLGRISVMKGGGELGAGFYTGQHLYEAKAWAFHCFGDSQKNVVKFSTPDDDVLNLSLKMLDAKTASLTRFRIRAAYGTRTYVFGVDMVWAPIIGSDRVNGDQYKWESHHAEAFLNGPNTTRNVL